MTRPALTPERYRRLRRDGRDVAEIAALTGLPAPQVTALARAWGLLGPAIDREAVRRLFQDGRSDADIARRLGWTVAAIKACRWQLGLIRPPGGNRPADRFRFETEQDRVWLSRIREREQRRATWVPAASSLDGNWA